MAAPIAAFHGLEELDNSSSSKPSSEQLPCHPGLVPLSPNPERIRPTSMVKLLRHLSALLHVIPSLCSLLLHPLSTLEDSFTVFPTDMICLGIFLMMIMSRRIACLAECVIIRRHFETAEKKKKTLFYSSMILVTQNAPSPFALGKANGIVLWAMCFSRASAPVIYTIFSKSYPM